MTKLDPQLVAHLPPFKDMHIADLHDLLSHARPRHVQQGEHVFSQGEKAQNFFILLDGTVRVVKISRLGEQVVARFIPAGELIGLAHALGFEEYPANAIAANDCLVLAWPNSLWDDLVKRFPSFTTSTYKTIGKRLKHTQDSFAELATARVNQRVAAALVNLSKKNGRPTDEGILIDFPISRQDIAEMTGTTLHTVSRLLSGWEYEGFVVSKRKKITIAKPDALSQIAEGGKEIV